MSSAREQEIIAAYRTWDSSKSSINDLAKSLGVSRATVYAILHRNDVPLRGDSGPVTREPEVTDALLDVIGGSAIKELMSIILRQQRALDSLTAAVRDYLDSGSQPALEALTTSLLAAEDIRL